ncbi:DEAD/DEAH box helicase [Photobacterium leiognathi]|uniref:DEAD/DEAH box helicase n=1 Tax=Photobacterium leiognathi TaxID=553611 RepID=A0ABX5GGF5_PHOLE|nr:DEAD/DEAH box helicase family protein [Photobacterium leiognathi]KJF88610.1 DEAD/DEAH box helicase [Photobacterium leiognathi]PSV82699.1 DEAD/DEAH box helicase [Photobacterium leiognathi]
MTDSISLYSGHNLTVGSHHDPLLDKLVTAINHASTIEISVSFIMKSGLDLLFDALLDALNRGAELRLLTSDYLSVTQPVALRELMLLVDKGANIRVFQCEGNISFHLKSYIFIKSHHDKIEQGCAWVGSNNMSKMALTQGHEWALRLDYEQPDHSKAALEFHHIRQQFDHLFANSLTHSLSHEWIDIYNTRYKKQNPHFIHLITTEAGSEVDTFVPNSIQTEALLALEQTRLNGHQRGLVVLATGMGKTWLSAFDAKQMNAKRVLFVAHREEILLKAERTFIQLNENIRTGRYNGTSKDTEADYLFASIQTIGRQEHLALFDKKHFDYVIVDEFHHASSSTYQALLAYFEPAFLLGLTATPERSDQADILSLCDNNLVFERNLVQGIDDKILVPFDYFGIYDQFVNYQEIPWRNGKFDPAALDTAFATQQRAQHILKHWKEKKLTRTLAFCISKKHADYMANFFCINGYKAVAVYSDSAVPRNEALTALQNGVIDIIFSVDLFNEGTDIPSIDTILMIRPTESKILFLQQLGRGLRQSKETQKDKLLVLDFIGNHQSFLTKPSALLDISSTREIAKRSAKLITLTDGCFINFDPELTQFWQELASRYKTTSIDEYRELKNILDHRPTATEFMQANYRLDKVKQQHSSWFSLVATEEQTPELVHLVKHYGEFLHKGIAQTSMTKCFKAILLEAFLNLDGFTIPPTTEVLAEQSLLVLNRYPELKEKDVAKAEQHCQPTDYRWHQYWLKNPIKAYTTANKNGEQWFSIIDGRFTANFNVEQEDKQQLHEAVKELVNLRLAQYVQRCTKAQI